MESTNNESAARKKEFTTARQVQAILYLLEDSGLPQIEKTEIARFIEFLTGKNYDNVYKRVLSPLKSRDQADNADLIYIKDWFRRLGLTALVEKIESAIKMKGV